MKLSRTVTYALQATLLLARSETDRPVPCSQLAAEGNMPERFLLQILRSLVNHNILRSTRGVDGGYSLVGQADGISLLDIIEAIDGPMSSGLPENEGFLLESQTELQNALKQVSLTARQQLGQIKMSQLIAVPAFNPELKQP